ncbi:type II toxin-antitoxin system Phd/YefM family antitoxin [Methylomagnum sp.]
MHWNIAQAKQRFSEVVKQAAAEPQLIYNRNQPVAALISAEDYAAFDAWRKTQAKPPTLAEDFDELRQLLLAEGFEDGLEIPARIDRPNTFVEALEGEYGALPR